MESISIEFSVRHRVMLLAQITALPAFIFACRLRARTHTKQSNTPDRQTAADRSVLSKKGARSRERAHWGAVSAEGCTEEEAAAATYRRNIAMSSMSLQKRPSNSSKSILPSPLASPLADVHCLGELTFRRCE